MLFPLTLNSLILCCLIEYNRLRANITVWVRADLRCQKRQLFILYQIEMSKLISFECCSNFNFQIQSFIKHRTKVLFFSFAIKYINDVRQASTFLAQLSLRICWTQTGTSSVVWSIQTNFVNAGNALNQQYYKITLIECPASWSWSSSPKCFLWQHPAFIQVCLLLPTIQTYRNVVNPMVMEGPVSMSVNCVYVSKYYIILIMILR